MSSQGTTKTPPWLIPDYPPLEGAVLKEAVEHQIIRYPMVVRSMRDPPIFNQAYANVSFMFFDKPETLKSGKPVYGFGIVRGAWESEKTATDKAETIIKEVDSRNQVRIAPMGQWFPLTPDNAVCQDLLDVRTRENETEQLRDRAAKDAEAKQREIQRELRERERELEAERDADTDKDHIRYYARRRVTEMRLREAIEHMQQRLSGMKRNLLKCRVELKQIDAKFPQHEHEWLDCYNAERAKTGIFKYVPSEHEFDEYEQSVLEEMERELAELE